MFYLYLIRLIYNKGLLSSSSLLKLSLTDITLFWCRLCGYLILSDTLSSQLCGDVCVTPLHPEGHSKRHSCGHTVYFMKLILFSVPKILFETESMSHSRKRKRHQEFPWWSVNGIKSGRKPLQNAKSSCKTERLEISRKCVMAKWKKRRCEYLYNVNSPTLK